MLRYTILLLFLLTIPVRANLGETVEQCVTRYGKPLGFTEAGAKNPFGTVTYGAGGYILTVFVFNNKEVGARVSKTDKSAFTDAEMQTIMAADSDVGPWTASTSNDPTCLQWSRADKATVLYDKDKHMLIFTSEEMEEAIHPATDKPTSTVPPPGN